MSPGQHRNLLLSEDRALVDGLGGHMHRHPCYCYASGQRVTNGVPALERRQ